MEDDTTFTKVFVGSLANTSDETSLRNYFEQFGNILDTVVILDGITGRSKRYGFVTFANPEDAQAACSNKHPYIDGLRVRCTPAINQPSQLPSSPPTHENATRMEENGSRTVYVAGITLTTSPAILSDYFKEFGNIVKIAIKTAARPTGIAFVTFSDQEQAQAACANQDTSIDGNFVSCKIAALRSQHSPPNHGPRMHSPTPPPSPRPFSHPTIPSYTHTYVYPNNYPMGYNPYYPQSYYGGGPNAYGAPSGSVPYNAPASHLENDDNR